MRHFHSLWRDSALPPLVAGSADLALQAIVRDAEIVCDPDWVLDVGAGMSGSCGIDLHPSAQRVAVDISAVPLMSSTATSDAYPVVADGCSLPFADEQFDIVTMMDLISVAEHPESLIVEAARVLRIGGRLIFNAQLLSDDTRSEYRLIKKENGSELRAGSQFLVRFYDPFRLEAVLDSLSLQIVERMQYELCHPGHWYHPSPHVHRYIAFGAVRV